MISLVEKSQNGTSNVKSNFLEKWKKIAKKIAPAGIRTRDLRVTKPH